MRAMIAFVLNLGGVDKYVTPIWGYSGHPQESGDLHTLLQHSECGGKTVQLKKISLAKGKIKRENLKRETHGPVVRQDWGKA
jgi:hypothetical protein